MRNFILCSIVFGAFALFPTPAKSQVVAQYYGSPYYYNYSTNYPSLYHQRLRYNNYNYYPYTGSRYSPYQNSWNRPSYYNAFQHRSYHRGRGYSSYYSPYYGYGRSGTYYNSPGFGFRFSF